MRSVSGSYARSLASPLRIVGPALLVLAFLLSAVATSDTVQARTGVISLGRGDSAFWNGPYIDRLQDFSNGEGRCGKSCFVYRIEVIEPAFRLRVAMDYPMGNDFFDMRLIDPSGDEVDRQSGGFYSREFFVKNPMQGTWKVRVDARSVSKSAFRLRAKLEASPPEPEQPPQRLEPNLRLEPPFQFTFRPPATMFGGVVLGGGGGASDGSCSYDETVENSAARCLRMSVGPQNAGYGPLEVRFSPVTDAATGEAPMFQIVHYSDGSTRERRAGRYEYHKTHGHYHFTGFAHLELFEVTDRDRGKLVRSGEGHKSGFCFGDVMMNSWSSFRQGSAGSSRSSCDDATEAHMGLSAGWTDIYDWSTPGNYVEFGDNRDGYYVVRAVVDAQDFILESDESDNVSYAYIKVSGKKIEVLERGFGMDPWDRNKEVATDWVQSLKRES